MKLRWEIAWGIFFGYLLVLLLSFVIAVFAFLGARLLMPDSTAIDLSNLQPAEFDAAPAERAPEEDRIKCTQSRGAGATYTYDGVGDDTTEEFKAHSAWWLGYEVDRDTSVSVTIDGLPSTGMTIDAGDASLGGPFAAGTYALDIETDGSWCFEVIEGADESLVPGD